MGNKTKALIGLIGISAVMIMFATISTEQKKGKLDTIKKPSFNTDTIKLDTFSEANLILQMWELDIKHPDIVLAQSKLETGNFKSYLFKESNNLFGFRTFTGYKRYKNWQCSLVDYAQWQTKKYKGGDYYAFLLYVGYAEDSLYIHKLKQF